MPHIPVLSQIGNHGDQALPRAIILDEDSKIKQDDEQLAYSYSTRTFERYRKHAGQDDENRPNRLATFEANKYKHRVLSFNDNEDLKREIVNEFAEHAGQGHQEPPWATAMKNDIIERIERLETAVDELRVETRKIWTSVHEMNARELQELNTLAEDGKLYEVPLKDGRRHWGKAMTFSRLYPERLSPTDVEVVLPRLNSVSAVNHLGENQVRGYLHGYYGEPLDEAAEGQGWKESTNLREKRRLVLVAIGADKR
ncbi:hypothetical protein E1B28_006364 [Marasmius oreades]|uniref:Mug135-like C-terminal domain-containing protein n=1 Tax=Marasmius oreades TaxID=181124 RepID=A0A9P7UW49_9AGAR|nr:uncharacterized protein E1B28_006364 [Marasmius oreades]KAG7095641.1 hypothetical protein E1B28_006364 [Marasmius oreades]